MKAPWISFFCFSFLLISVTHAEDFIDLDLIPDYAKDPVLILVKKGILQGNEDGSFAPKRSINRAEFSKLIVEATSVKKYVPINPSFPDVTSEDWFFPYVETARKEGWISGYPDGEFKPAENINRAEIAKMLTLAFDLQVSKSDSDQYWFDAYVRALAERKLLPYNTENAIFNPSKRPDRAEVSEHIYKVMVYTGQIEKEYFDVAVIDTRTNRPIEEVSEFIPFEEREIIDYLPEKTEEVEFVYEDEDALTQKIESLAGEMHIQSRIDAPRRTYAAANQGNIEILSLNFWGDEGTVKIKELQFRLNGNKGKELFDKIWITANNKIVSERITPTTDIVSIKLNNEITFEDEWISLKVMADVRFNVESGDSARAVLFLPEWIASNTNKKIGFFPFGGPDIIVE